MWTRLIVPMIDSMKSAAEPEPVRQKFRAEGGGAAEGGGVCSEPMELLMRQTRWKSCEVQRSTLNLK